MKRCKSGSTLVSRVLVLGAAALLLAGAASALPPDRVRSRREPDDPQRVVGVLHDQVEWWARDANPVALAGEFSIDLDSVEDPEAEVDWRLVLTTLDREVVTSWSGSTPLRNGRGIAFLNFEGRDADGHPLPAGTYVYRFEAEGFEGSGGFVKVWASDEVPAPKVPDELPQMVTSANPAIPWNFYFGSHHNHTTYSDGGIPVASCTGSIESAHAGADPAAAYTYAKNTAGLDFLSILDHNHIFDTACGTCTTAQIRARYQAGLTAAANASSSTFVGIFGQEWGVISNGGHVALYEYTKLFGWDAFSDVITTKSDYPNLWNTIANAAYQGPYGSMAGFCHPSSSDFGSFAQNAAGLANVRAIAVISGPAFSTLQTYADAGTRYSGPKASGDRYQYVLQRGWKVGPEAHGDNHCYNYGASTRNRTVLLATSLGKASVMDAMLNRRFYTSSDKNAQMFFGTADLTKVMGQTFTTASASLDLLAWISDPDGSAVSTVTLYTGNPAAGSGSPTSAAMTNAGSGSYTATVTVPASGSAYYYVYATLANGGELFSAPIWVSRGGCSDTTAPTASITAPTATTVTGTVTVSAAGSDNVGVTGMTLAIDGSTVATSTSGSVSYSWNTTGLTAGSSHSITATATDACGNVSGTATKSVTIGGTTTTYTISGSAGTSGATVTAGSATATSDASSNYTLAALVAGTYTVTPTKSGCTFSPASQSVTVSSANVTGVNFTASCTSGDVQLTNGVAVTGQSVAASAWKYYYITVPSGATNLTLATTSATGDVDIYTQSGAKPTSSSYACRPYTSSGNESCSATNPVAGTWWLGVYGYAAGSYTVTGTYTLGGTTYSISGSAGTSGATVSVGSASATSDASNNYTIAGLGAGTYTVTPSKSGCTFSPASASVTITSANVTGKNFTATCGGGATTLFTDGFESAGWSFANVSGTTGYWTLAASGTHPAASPHAGGMLAAFNSYTAASGVQKRMYRATGFAVASTYTTVTLKFWMYHDTGYSTYADKVQAQVSTNGTTWTNVGSAINRYSSTAGWAQATIDLSAYKGQTVYLAFLGISAYGNDCYLDDVTVTAQ